MNACREFEETISALLDGELADSDRPALMEHLAHCPACRAYLEDLSAVRTVLRGEDAPVPEGFAGKVTDKISAVSRKRAVHWQRWGALAACCAVAAVGILGAGRMGFFGGTKLDSAANAGAPNIFYQSQFSADTAVPETDIPAGSSDGSPGLVGGAFPMEEPAAGNDAAEEKAEETAPQAVARQLTVTVSQQLAEGFTAAVLDGDSSFSAGKNVTVVFSADTRFLLADGSAILPGDARDALLAPGATVSVVFSSWAGTEDLLLHALLVEAAG